MSFITERRKGERCPKCEGKFIEFLLNPIPVGTDRKYCCLSCGHQFRAKRDADRKAWNDQAQEYC